METDMDAVLRSAAVYFTILVLMRISGRRTMGDMTAFDLVLLLIISEATQPALTGDNYSVSNSMTVVTTMLLLDIGLSLLKRRLGTLERWLDGVPTLIVEDGRPIRPVMDRARVDEQDVLAAARQNQGLERMDQIKYAVLEADGKISVIPR